MAKAMKLFCVLLTVALAVGMAGMADAQPDDPCLDYECDSDNNCNVGYTCCEKDQNACGQGLGYCCNPCDYPCWVDTDCKEGWGCFGPGTCNAGMGYCWKKETVPAPPVPDPNCSDPTFHCSDDSQCGGEGFICYGYQDNLCGPGLGYCTTA